MKTKVQQNVTSIMVFVGVVWGTFIFSFLVPFDLNRFGVTPRTWLGLVGIATMPFLHATLHHLVSNTVPLLILLVLLVGSKAQSWQIIVAIMLSGGLLLWLLGRPATHIGASGLVFGLIVFLIVSGLLERRIIPLLISVIVGSLYGGTLLAGVVPRLGTDVSWDGHLCNAVAGGFVAYVLRKGRATGR